MPKIDQVRQTQFNDEEIGMGFNSESGLAIGSALEEIGEVIARFKSFPTIAAAAPVAYETELATYDTLPLPRVRSHEPPLLRGASPERPAWNNNADFAARGAKIAIVDADVATKRAAARGTPPVGLAAGLYWLGFDIATGIFGDPKLGANGNTLIGPGSEKIRATLGPDGRQGFNDFLAFNVVRR